MQSQGVQLATMQELARYWGTDYDWRKVEARLNALPQFVTEIDGLDIHFIHVRSKARKCVADDRHPRVAGLDHRAAEDHRPADQPNRAWRERVGRVSRGDPVAAGLRLLRQADGARVDPRPHRAGVGDADAAPRLHEVTSRRAAIGGMPSRRRWPCRSRRDCSASTRNMAATVPPNISKALALHEPPPADLTAEERNAWNQLDFFYTKGLGYAIEMNNRPQTLYGIVDSPVGLAAWMLDHDDRSEKMIARAFAGQSEGLTRDDVLDNVTLYWLTNTAISSARLYWDTAHASSGGLLRRKGRQDSGRRQRLPRRDLCGPAELGGAGLPEADPLQQARQRRSLRGVGTAATLR